MFICLGFKALGVSDINNPFSNCNFVITRSPLTMETSKLKIVFCTVATAVMLVKSAHVQSQRSQARQDKCFGFEGASSGNALGSGPSGGGPPPTKNPFVTKPTPSSKLSFKFTEEELSCKKAQRDQLQKDIWMFEIRYF